jgi:hypothetical protein
MDLDRIERALRQGPADEPRYVPGTFERRSPKRLPWALVALAVVAATALVAALLIGIGLFLRSPNVGPPSVPTATPFPTARVQNGLIAVSANPMNVGGGEVGDIYLVAEGAAARRIIGFDGDGLAQACPMFSPNGQRLAYGEARASGPVTTFRGVWPVPDRAVVVVGLNDHGDASPPIMRVNLPTDPGQIPCPEWSPGGTQIAFRVGAGLWIADASSGKTTIFPVTEAPFGQQEFEWSRDGSMIAVSEPGQIRVVRADGGTSTLIPVKGATPGSLGWTAGDARIIYISTDAPGDGLAVNVVAVGGTNGTQLTPDSADLQVRFDYAALSPDGTRVAYAQRAVRCDNNGCTLVDIPPLLITGNDGSNVVEPPIPPGFGVSALQWSPDGQQLLLVSTGGIVSVGVTTGSPLVVSPSGELNLEWSGSEVTWQPRFE